MNEKISFPDLVGLLSSKMNITKKEAETFLKEFFTVSTEVITSGEELRINGLGLFKPIWVEARGSINIQTGEPVEIMRDHPEIVKILNGYQEIPYDMMIESVKQDGLRIYGFSIVCQKEKLLQLRDEEEISYLYAVPLD